MRIDKEGCTQYLVRWVGCTCIDDTWEHMSALKNAPDKVLDFKRAVSAVAGRGTLGSILHGRSTRQRRCTQAGRQARTQAGDAEEEEDDDDDDDDVDDDVDDDDDDDY